MAKPAGVCPGTRAHIFNTLWRAPELDPLQAAFPQRAWSIRSWQILDMAGLSPILCTTINNNSINTPTTILTSLILTNSSSTSIQYLPLLLLHNSSTTEPLPLFPTTPLSVTKPSSHTQSQHQNTPRLSQQNGSGAVAAAAAAAAAGDVWAPLTPGVTSPIASLLPIDQPFGVGVGMSLGGLTGGVVGIPPGGDLNENVNTVGSIVDDDEQWKDYERAVLEPGLKGILSTEEDPVIVGVGGRVDMGVVDGVKEPANKGNARTRNVVTEAMKKGSELALDPPPGLLGLSSSGFRLPAWGTGFLDAEGHQHNNSSIIHNNSNSSTNNETETDGAGPIAAVAAEAAEYDSSLTSQHSVGTAGSGTLGLRHVNIPPGLAHPSLQQQHLSPTAKADDFLVGAMEKMRVHDVSAMPANGSIPATTATTTTNITHIPQPATMPLQAAAAANPLTTTVAGQQAVTAASPSHVSAPKTMSWAAIAKTAKHVAPTSHHENPHPHHPMHSSSSMDDHGFPAVAPVHPGALPSSMHHHHASHTSVKPATGSTTETAGLKTNVSRAGAGSSTWATMAKTGMPGLMSSSTSNASSANGHIVAGSVPGSACTNASAATAAAKGVGGFMGPKMVFAAKKTD
ncbi:hypothetical protein HK102_008071, partial [Quaeritorhiza haematococci]